MSIPNLAAIRDWCLEKFSLNPATANDLGGIKVGSGLSVTQDGTLSASGGGGGDTELNDLSDVTVSSPSAGQILKYNDSTSKFENASAYVRDAADVNVVTPYAPSNKPTFIKTDYQSGTGLTFTNVTIPIDDLWNVYTNGHTFKDGDRLEYDLTNTRWEPAKGRSCDLLYDSGGLNTYAATNTNVPLDLNYPSMHGFEDYDELAIMLGFTDVTYSEANFMEARFHVAPYLAVFPNMYPWHDSNPHRIPLIFNDNKANPSRQIDFSLTLTDIGSPSYYQYGFNYITESGLTSRIPGIRKIYGLKY